MSLRSNGGRKRIFGVFRAPGRVCSRKCRSFPAGRSYFATGEERVKGKEEKGKESDGRVGENLCRPFRRFRGKHTRKQISGYGLSCIYSTSAFLGFDVLGGRQLIR